MAVADPETILRERGGLNLVTGATGFTGAVLARRLLAAGLPVRVLVRSAEKARAKGLAEAEIVEGSVADPDAVATALPGVRTVFHLAAVYREGGLRDEAYREVHREGTRRMVEAASAEGGVERFVHCSTVGIHGHIEHPPADENAPVAPGDIYQQTKWEGEQAAWQGAAERDLPVSVVRPTAIFGPEDERLLKLFRLAQRSPALLLGRGTIGYHMVQVEDLVDGFLLAATRPEAVGEAFIIGGEQAASLNEIVRTMARLSGRSGRILHLPAPPFQWAGSLCERLCIPLGIAPPIYRRRVDFFTKSRDFTIAKARERLGYRPRYSLEEGLRETLAGYRERGWL
jgi:nucleoside-diphosphate-sugar epimerase